MAGGGMSDHPSTVRVRPMPVTLQTRVELSIFVHHFEKGDPKEALAYLAGLRWARLNALLHAARAGQL